MDQETMKQFAELLDAKLAANNQAIFTEMQQLRADVKQDIDGVRTEMQQDMQQLRAEMQEGFAVQEKRTDDMLHDQTEGIVQMTRRMIDESAETVMRHMTVLLENNQDKKIQSLYEDLETVKEDVRQLKAKAANE